MRRGKPLAATLLGLLLAGCGSSPAVSWHIVPESPPQAMTTGAALLGDTTYLTYVSQSGTVLLQRVGGPALRVPASETGIAAPGTALTPVTTLSERIYLATGNGVLGFTPPSRFLKPMQIPLGTPPLSVTASGHSIFFDELATYDTRSRTEIGPAVIVRWTPGEALARSGFPHGLRPLPAPLATAGGRIYLIAAPEPETAFYLLSIDPKTLVARITSRFPSSQKPLTLAADGVGVLVLLQMRSTGRLALWYAGKVTPLRLPPFAGAASGAGLATLATSSRGSALLGLPGLPSDRRGTLGKASLWRIDPRTGDAKQMNMPRAPRHFTAAPALSETRKGVLAAWQGEYAFLP